VTVFCVAFLLVLVAAWSVEVAERRIWTAQQQTKVDDIASTFDRQASADSAYLAAMGSLLGNVGRPSPRIFGDYVRQLRGISDLSGVVALGWIERFDEKDLADLRQRVAMPPTAGDSDQPDTSSFPTAMPGKWPVYLSAMLEPQNGGGKWSSRIDPRADAPWAGTVDRVMKTGAIATAEWSARPQASGQTDRPAFLALAPAPGTGREPRFRGIAFVLVRTKDFVSAAVDPRLMRGGHVELFKRTAGGETRIFSSQPHAGRLAPPLAKEVGIFDQHWTLRYWPPARGGLSILSLVILFGGTAFALLLLAYVLLVQRRTIDLHALLDVQLLQERERAAFIRELNHRVKNTLANVTSIISLTRNRTDDVQMYADMLLQRVRALAAGHSLLEDGQWAPADLRAIFRAQLAVNDKAVDRVVLEGPDVRVVPHDALTIGLAAHELTTNALRYGALSTEEGRLTIRWHVIEGDWVQVDWEERGGPTVVTPEKLGFGLMLVQRALAHELQRPIDLSFDPEGFRCRFFFQLRELRSFQLRR
jgi:two-component sensor histidine kinase